MTALSEARRTPQRDGVTVGCPVAASTKIFVGALVVETTGGFAKGGDALASTYRAVGRAEETVDNLAGNDGDAQVRVSRGVFQWLNAAGADAVQLSDRNTPCYVVDDQTVAATSDGGARSPAGIVVDVDDAGVWVDTSWGAVVSAAGSLAVANDLSDLSDAATARGNLGVNTIHVPVHGLSLVGADATVVRLVAPVTGALSGITSVLEDALATGDATITAAIDGVDVTDGVVTIAQAGSAAGDIDAAMPSALNAVVAGTSVITLTVGGSNDATATAGLMLAFTF